MRVRDLSIDQVSLGKACHFDIGNFHIHIKPSGDEISAHLSCIQKTTVTESRESHGKFHSCFRV